MRQSSIKAYAPGRINVIGEHTDYNDGYVLPAAIDKKLVFEVQRNGDPAHCCIQAKNIEESFEFKLHDFKPIPSGWPNYVMGVVNELQKSGADLKGFNGVFYSDIPIGSGLSSSAALECALAVGLNKLFNLDLDKWQLIKVCQLAEHNFVGIKCGIMDQFASVMGKKDHVMLLDCRSLQFDYFPFDLKAYQLLLLNTNVSHTLASSVYNTRREECEAGVIALQQKFPNTLNLRDTTIDMLQQVTSKIPETVFKRCNHVVKENDRVLAAIQVLKKNDFATLGKLMYQSHFSLKNDYEVSCPQLDFLVQLAMENKHILGSRMMGGGFGGCTLTLIEKQQVNSFVELAAKAYRNKFGIDLTTYEVALSDGAGVMVKE